MFKKEIEHIFHKADIIPDTESILEMENNLIQITDNIFDTLNKIVELRKGTHIELKDIELLQKNMNGGDYIGFCDNHISQCQDLFIMGSMGGSYNENENGYLIIDDDVKYYVQNGQSFSSEKFNQLINQVYTKPIKKKIRLKLQQVLENILVEIMINKNNYNTYVKQNGGSIKNELLTLKKKYKEQLFRLKSFKNSQIGGKKKNVNNEIKDIQNHVKENIRLLSLWENNLSRNDLKDINHSQHGGVNIWSKITDPISNLKYDINSNKGRQLLNKYLKNIN